MWSEIYKQWCDIGDYQLLAYLQKIQIYLEREPRYEFEVENLRRQIAAIMKLPSDACITLNHGYNMDPLSVSWHMGGPSKLPDPTNDTELLLFFQNSQRIRIQPQNVGSMNVACHPCHPCWILWTALYNKAIATELWAYRDLFIYFMGLEDYASATRTFQHAYNMKGRREKLPRLDYRVLRSVMDQKG